MVIHVAQIFLLGSQPELQRAVHSRFLDQSTLVREAAVDLVGRFILVRPQLTTQYYEMLSERILVRSYTSHFFHLLNQACKMKH